MRAHAARRVFQITKPTAIDVVASIRSLRARIPTTAVVIHSRQSMPSSFSPRKPSRSLSISSTSSGWQVASAQARSSSCSGSLQTLFVSLYDSINSSLSPLHIQLIAMQLQSCSSWLLLRNQRQQWARPCLACAGPATQSRDRVPAPRCPLQSPQDPANSKPAHE